MRAGQGDADGVAHEHASGLAVHEAHQVLGVAGRVEHVEVPTGAEVDAVTLVDGFQPVLGHRGHGAPQLLHALLAVHAGGAVPEAIRRTEVSRPLGMHEDGGGGEVLGQAAGAAAVVEVHVGHDDVGQVVRPHTLLLESSDHAVEAGLRPRLDERGTGAGEEVARQLMLLVVHQRIDCLDRSIRSSM